MCVGGDSVAGALELERNTELSRLLSFVVFAAGVFIPSVVAAVRLFIIGVHNARLFGSSPTDPIHPGTDPTLWTTAVLITVATALLAVLVAMEARHRKVLVSGIVLAGLAAIPLALNWYVIVE
jgi:hypothetical protein